MTVADFGQGEKLLLLIIDYTINGHSLNYFQFQLLRANYVASHDR